MSEAQRLAFERDAEPLGFSLVRTANVTGEPWCDYADANTGHRWAGWLALAEQASGKAQQAVGSDLSDDEIDAWSTAMMKDYGAPYVALRNFARTVIGADRMLRDADLAEQASSQSEQAAWFAGLDEGRAQKASGKAQQAAERAPDGWKLVPIEPTPDMLKAFHNGFLSELHKPDKKRTCTAEEAGLRAMLAATPPETPAAQQAVGGEPVATVKRDGLPAFGFATILLRWESGADKLPLGEHKLYAHPPSDQASEKGDAETHAYAEGRGDQFEDDCEVVHLLFENLDDTDLYGNGAINTTRVRELLAHFDIPRPVECSGLECTRPECDSMGCTADRINTEREQRIAALSPKAPK